MNVRALIEAESAKAFLARNPSLKVKLSQRGYVESGYTQSWYKRGGGADNRFPELFAFRVFVPQDGSWFRVGGSYEAPPYLDHHVRVEPDRLFPVLDQFDRLAPTLTPDNFSQAIRSVDYDGPAKRPTA